MLGALTYHLITALTRDRLSSIEQQLLAKIRSQQNVSPLERQVYFLARTAREGMSLPPHLPREASLPPFARELSLHTVFGSVGPTFPIFAALYAPSQRWLFDTLQSGNPDPNRQRVLARSTDLLLSVAERGKALINASDVADRPAELLKLRAYILGHACHIAADVISAPFVNAAVWQFGEPGRGRLSLEQVASAIDKASAQLFRRDLRQTDVLAARGNLYADWWLKPNDLPRGLLDAFREALEATYGAGARAILRPSAPGASPLVPQVSPAFWRQFDADAPPELSLRLLEDGYAAFRSVMESSYVWTFGDWVAGTAWMFLPALGAYPLIVALPHTRALFKDNALVEGQPVDRELGWFGLLMAPLATSALAPLVMSIYIAAVTYFGVGRETVFGWFTGGLNLITCIVFLATIGSDVDAVVRWLLLFGLPFGGLLVHAIYVLARGGSDPRHVQLALSSLIPCAIVVVYLLFHLAWHQSQDLGMNGWLDDGWGSGGFIGGWVLWAVLLVGAWLLTSYLLMPNRDAEPALNEFVTNRKHFVRLFGHSSLLFDPDLAQDPNTESRNPSLATHYFPSDRRPLLKIWWTGANDVWLRSDRNALQFSSTEDGTGDPQTVLAPAAPMTAAEFARFLTQAVKEGSSFNQTLKAEVFEPEDFDYVLPPGDVFADAGDEKALASEHDTEAARFLKVSTDQAAPTVLYHAPRWHLAGFQGTRGAVQVDTDRAAAVAGAGQATFAGTTVTGSAATHFGTFFKPGDVIATTGVAAGNESRIVTSVQDDQTLTVNQAFTPAVGGGPRNYARAANTRDVDTPAGGLQATNTFRVYQGTGFDAMFLPGDTIRAVPGAGVAPEERTVIQVISATQLMVDKPFAVAVPGTLPPGPAVPCVRVGRQSREGFLYMGSSPIAAFAGDTLMERAADLGAILSMGALTHTLSTTERQAVTAGPDERRRPAVNPVYQVFRNWNLGQRRLNEWQMLVSGGAVSEKRSAPRNPDPLQPGVPSGWTTLTPDGEQTANQLGWLPVFERWLDVARRPGVDSLADEAFREGDPTNRKLSEAIAFLLDLPMPA